MSDEKVAGFVLKPFSALVQVTEFLSKMTETKYSRKMDNIGRLLIPSKLREQLNLSSGTEYTFFLHEDNNRRFLCIECPVTNEEIEKARKLLQLIGEKS